MGYDGSVRYKIGKVSLFGQYGESDILIQDSTSTNVGLHSNFNKNAKVYIYYRDFQGNIDLDTLCLSLEYKF